MSYQYNKICEIIQNKTKEFSFYNHFIMDWSDKYIDQLPPFPYSEDEKSIFEQFLSAGEEGIILEESDLSKDLIKESNRIYHYEYYNCDLNDCEKDTWFPSNFDCCLQFSFLFSYLKYCNSNKEIEFLLYGKKHNHIETIKGKITKEGILWP